tara:strand:- start:2825 stop:3367 length:543 start_codon:yes stop_codon:yes gene_type:complete
MAKEGNHIHSDGYLDSTGNPYWKKKYDINVYADQIIKHADQGHLCSIAVLAGVLKVTASNIYRLRINKPEFAELIELAQAISASVNAINYSEAAYQGIDCNQIIAKDMFERSQRLVKRHINVEKSAKDLVQSLVDGMIDGWLDTKEVKELRETILAVDSLTLLEEMKNEIAKLKQERSDS